ncbi:hypothetical protein F5B19DRAFT_466383 [Rostrohypoxylon terebratum]|nr:hypothetical protein F5B19DRAFT_466383 [Rostrohypoxylon terebratum]
MCISSQETRDNSDDFFSSSPSRSQHSKASASFFFIPSLCSTSCSYPGGRSTVFNNHSFTSIQWTFIEQFQLSPFLNQSPVKMKFINILVLATAATAAVMPRHHAGQKANGGNSEFSNGLGCFRYVSNSCS